MTAYLVSGVGQGVHFVPLQGKQASMLAQGQQYLRAQMKQHPRMRPDLRAAVVYALAESGDKNISEALDVEWSRFKDLQPESFCDDRTRDAAGEG